MRRLILSLFLLSLSLPVLAQTPCTSANPCAVVPITNGNTLPSPTALWTCQGVASVCTQAALTAAEGTSQTLTSLCPATTGPWTCTEFSQTKTLQNYNYPVAWAELINFSVQGSNGTGGVSANGAIVAFQVPQAPAQAPVLGTINVITTGTTGPQ